VASWMDDLPSDQEEAERRRRRLKIVLIGAIMPLVLIGYWGSRGLADRSPPPPSLETYTELVSELSEARMHGETLVLVAGARWNRLSRDAKQEAVLQVMEATGSQHLRRIEVQSGSGKVLIWATPEGEIGGQQLER
jgi:hypothetical protein